ncbi:MAG: DUF2273 domain-containing protein [Firmicutes bacterium]|nr:DUF2273 domain-containing protein [Bacillota bacterium]MDD4263598.1 DUF2273 domain-containing protein [Bacillota bacterium]MDD4693907.1 DUF2273 domain-containing protein [Bacillota bacterium]
MSTIKEILDRLSPYKGRILGVIFGFFMAIVILNYGFFRSLVIAIFIFIGFYLGKQVDNRETLSDLWERLWRNRNG